jgi:dethiobiotin synthetase
LTPIIITGIGTGVGKTLVSAIITEALLADYWKPVQAGFEGGTDSQWIKSMISNTKSKIYPELYKLRLSASPHIAAREEGVEISLQKIKKALDGLSQQSIDDPRHSDLPHPGSDFLVIEGAGGLLVPLNEKEFVIDLIKKLDAKVILVSRNYLGSINHSLLTAQVCKFCGLQVLGWVFNDQYLNYEDEIIQWSAFPKIASIPFCDNVNKEFVLQQAAKIKQTLLGKSMMGHS